MKNIRIFYLKICQFLVVKFSIYLNRHVFVMTLSNQYPQNMLFYGELDNFHFHVKTGTRFSLRDKRLFEISEVDITRVD